MKLAFFFLCFLLFNSVKKPCHKEGIKEDREGCPSGIGNHPRRDSKWGTRSKGSGVGLHTRELSKEDNMLRVAVSKYLPTGESRYKHWKGGGIRMNPVVAIGTRDSVNSWFSVQDPGSEMTWHAWGPIEKPSWLAHHMKENGKRWSLELSRTY